MGFFGYSQTELNRIASVIILNTTNLYRRTTRWGLNFSNSSPFGDPFVMDGGTEPDGAETTFSITYKSGRKEIVKQKSGTKKYDQLMQLALDPPSGDSGAGGFNILNEIIEALTPGTYFNKTHTHNQTDLPVNAAPPTSPPPYQPVKAGKNELPGGKYVIGQDIPPGAYDFTWVWGSPFFKKYKSTDLIPKNINYTQYIGAQHEYEYRQLLHIQCEQGELIDLDGNVIVKISRSPEIQLDL